MNTINKNLKELRAKKGITQQNLADQLYVTRQCISRWEQGKTLPDINNIEKVAEALDCSINDLVDDNSIKSLTIREAINSKKNRTILWITLTISVIAIIGTLLSIFIFNKPEEVIVEEYDGYYGYVKEIDNDLLSLTIEEYDTKEIIYFDYWGIYLSVQDNRENSIGYDDIKLGDKLYVNQTSLNEYELTVIDSEIDEELFGVYISAIDNDYSTFDEVRADYKVMYVHVSDGGSSSRLTQSYNYDYILEDLYNETIYDIYILVNPLDVQDEIQIGLITSNGMRIAETIDVNDLRSIYTYKGEIVLNSTDEDYIDNFNVTFNIHIRWEFSYTDLQVFEYDKNNSLIKETTINNLTELRNFEADSEALYCLLKVDTTLSNGTVTRLDSKVYRIYLGDSIEVYQSDDYGIVFTEWFNYK
ncbi:helix-turn-helix transcriptional regulator [Mycoplasmatota bacterium WC30]